MLRVAGDVGVEVGAVVGEQAPSTRCFFQSDSKRVTRSRSSSAGDRWLPSAVRMRSSDPRLGSCAEHVWRWDIEVNFHEEKSSSASARRRCEPVFRPTSSFAHRLHALLFTGGDSHPSQSDPSTPASTEVVRQSNPSHLPSAFSINSAEVWGLGLPSPAISPASRPQTSTPEAAESPPLLVDALLYCNA